MRWENKGHELDEEASEILNSFKNGEKIYIFGAGVLGKRLKKFIDFLIPENAIVRYIDNDKKKQEQGVNGVEVLSFETYQQIGEKGLLVVAAGSQNIPLLCQQIEQGGLQKYYLWHDFKHRVLPILLTYFYDKSYVELAQISVTERCTLRCKKCAHACPMTNNKSVDLKIEEVFASADMFFGKVDLIEEFVLIGGEPLLYKSLVEAVEYIGKKYRGRMMIFSITTNGTLLPDAELLAVCKKYNVLFRISDYSGTLPKLSIKYEQLIDILSKNGIEYCVNSKDVKWFDYGFDYVNREVDEVGLIKVFDECNTPCREIRGSKYYYCVMARSVSENMKRDIGKTDFLDIGELSQPDYKKILLEFNFGFSEKGYLDMCRHCNGADVIKYRIPIAEQI